jgi:hypothetical protein
MLTLEREVAPPQPDPSEAPADLDRPYRLDRERAAGGTGAPHLHREPDATQPDEDRFWACRRKGCRKRPVYLPARDVVDDRRSDDPDRPRRVTGEAWSGYLQRWDFEHDPSPSAVEARRARAERLAAAERRRAEEDAAARAAAERWTCPEHPDGLPFASDRSGTWTARCGTGDCERGWPPAPTEDPKALFAEDRNGWRCPRHGLDAIRKLRWDKDVVVRSCAWCPEMEHPGGQRVMPAVAAAEEYFARTETDESRRRRDLEEARRVEAERVATLPRCATCYVDIEAHARNMIGHEFDVMRKSSRRQLAGTPAFVVAGVLAAVLFLFVSATTAGVPFHEVTGRLVCMWDVRPSACG